MNARTRKHERLLPKKVLPWQTQPSWSAKGDKPAFAGNKHPLPVILGRDLHNAWHDKQVIFVVNQDGAGLKQLVEEAGPYAQYPELSPNEAEVLYTRKINGQFQIFKLDLNSSIQTQLTHIRQILQANSGGGWFDPTYLLPVSPQPQLLSTVWGKVKKK